TLDVTLITADDLICNKNHYLPTYLSPSTLNLKPFTIDTVSDLDVLRMYVKGNRASIESLHFTLQQSDILSEIKIYLRESKHESGFWYLEIRAINANKGTALQRYMVEHGINKHNTIGIGDYRNDMSLLQSCGYKVALANGVAELRELADYVTKDTSDNGGIDEILERVLHSITKR
ncbi:MAG: HAD hydrolase family protein, partial [Candidatus Kapabacteria bacterium]|nr:HAD hydrolase family protein [Candidatus Kapabacteria bacterium]